MADFSTSVLVVLRNEGAFSNEEHDAGGETYKGIARNFHPDWPGWATIDSAKDQPGFPSTLDMDAALQQAVLDFYRTSYWAYDGIENQDAATKILDMTVNMGKKGGITYLQQALKSCEAGPIVADGVYGPETEKAVNAAAPSDLLRELRFQSVSHYTRIVLAIPSQEKFLAGWLARAVQ